MSSLSNSSQSTRPTGRVLGKNYSFYVDFTCNYDWKSRILSAGHLRTNYDHLVVL